MKRTAMSKWLIFSAISSLLLVGFSSCERCTVCTYTQSVTNEEIVEEYCGSEKDVAAFESEFTAEWILNGGYCLRN